VKKLGKKLLRNKKLEEILKQLDYMGVQMMRLEQQVRFYKSQFESVRKAQEDFFEAGRRVDQGRTNISGSFEERLAKLEDDMLELKKRNWHLAETQEAMKDLFQKALIAVKEKEQSIKSLQAENERLKEKSSLLDRVPARSQRGDKSIDALMERIAQIDTGIRR
jgi:hypothetical protein